METKDKTFIIDENLKQSIWKDTWMFTGLTVVLAVNHNWLGSSWVTELFIWLIFFCYAAAFASTKKMTKREAYDILKKEFESKGA
jgi:hypothetical protein